jgi:hypothetical protein
VRVWWQDVLIETMGGLLGTVAAAVVLGVAGRAAGLFDAARDFDFRRFWEVTGSTVAAITVLLGIIIALVQLLFVD